MARKRQPLTQSTWVVTSPSPRKRLYLKLPIENEVPTVANDQGQDVPDDAKQKIISAISDLETFEDETQ